MLSSRRGITSGFFHTGCDVPTRLNRPRGRHLDKCPPWSFPASYQVPASHEIPQPWKHMRTLRDSARSRLTLILPFTEYAMKKVTLLATALSVITVCAVAV